MAVKTVGSKGRPLLDAGVPVVSTVLHAAEQGATLRILVEGTGGIYWLALNRGPKRMSLK
jgi:hypothetical protein